MTNYSPEGVLTADYSTKPRNWPKEEEHVQVNRFTCLLLLEFSLSLDVMYAVISFR